MIMRDFQCAACGEAFEDLVVNACVTQTPCPACDQLADRVMSAVRIGTMNDPVRRTEELKKRSIADTHKQVGKEPEKFGMTGKRSPWNVRGAK